MVNNSSLLQAKFAEFCRKNLPPESDIETPITLTPTLWGSEHSCIKCTLFCSSVFSLTTNSSAQVGESPSNRDRRLKLNKLALSPYETEQLQAVSAILELNSHVVITTTAVTLIRQVFDFTTEEYSRSSSVPLLSSIIPCIEDTENFLDKKVVNRLVKGTTRY